MTYDTKSKILHTGVYEKVKLTKLEHKLLICLSSGNLATYEEMTRYLHTSVSGILKLRSRLAYKQLNVNVVRGLGFRIDNEIYFR